MKKIGIVTFHCVENYGAFLQTYASSQVLKQINQTLDVAVINYCPIYLKSQNQIDLFAWTKPENTLYDNLKAIFLYLITVPDRLYKKKRFLEAMKSIPVRGKPFSSQDSYDGESYDYLYLGSDQIWNPEITCGIDPIYFGELYGCDNAIKFSYAASFGGASYSDKDIDVLCKFLNKLSYIGVREKSSKAFVTTLIGRNAYAVLDPVLLLHPDTWYACTQKRLHKQRYILAYQLRENAFLLEQAQEYAQVHGYDLLHFGDRGLREMKRKSIECVSSAGPFEFINYIRYADAVFTDSFHATCFSLIFERLLFTYLHETRSSRIVDLGTSLGFVDFMIPCGKLAKLNNISSIPAAAKSTLAKQRKESLAFLQKILNDI